jgi:TusA-related sulfurtransferase
MKQVPPGEVMEVVATVAEHAFVVRAWARKTGRTVVDDRMEGKTYHLLVRQSADG